MAENLTLKRLKRIVLEEKKKMQKAGVIPVDDVETVEDVWSGGKNLVHQVDFIKALGIKEARLRKKADKVSRAKQIIKKRLIRKL